MDYQYLFLGVSFSASVFSALFCLVLLALKLGYTKPDQVVRKVTVVLLLFYIICMVFYSTTFFDEFDLVHYSCFKGLNFISSLLMPTIFFHLIFLVTRLKKIDTWNPLHYLSCVTIGVVFYFYHMSELEVKEVDYLKQIFPSFLLHNEGKIMASLYNILYLILGLYRLRQYRKNISNYSSNEEQDSLRWLYPIFILGFLLFPGSIMLYVIPEVKTSLVVGELVSNFLFMFFNIGLCYNVFCVNFSFVKEDILEEEPPCVVKQKKEKEGSIAKEKFEQYMLDKKPFLNSQLKITDLLADLITNRSYLSLFINTTYEMNFSQYINQCRYKEYLELKMTLSQTKTTEEDLILASGFRSYESFKRTEYKYIQNKKLERKAN